MTGPSESVPPDQTPPPAQQGTRTERGARLRAWAVHGLTALGAVIAMLALFAVIEGDARAALLWLGLATIVDGIDGPLARRYEVATALPRIDGAVLDLVIDYLTYVFVPAFIISQLGFVPDGTATFTAIIILVTALYTFANRDMKTGDNYFEGFPAVWNVVALHFYVLAPAPWLSFAAVLALAALTFVPVKFVHPFRVRAFRPLTLAATGIWGALSILLVLWDKPYPFWALFGWCLCGVYFAAIGLWRSWRGARPA